MRKIHLMKAKLFLGFGLMAGLLFLQDHKASASGTVEPVTVDTVDYEEEEIILNNNGNTKIFFATEADAARGSWEVIPVDVNAEDKTIIDISWVPNTLESILKVKGGDDPAGTQARIVLPARTTKLDISINYSNINTLAKTDAIAPLLNIMTTAGTSANPITFADLEWKKGENGYWKNIGLLTVAQLEKYQIKGTELYFRIKADNDDETRVVGGVAIYPDGTRGRRASSEVKVKINKKATAMVVGVDGSKFTADIKYGKEYRATIGSKRTDDWIKVTDKLTKRLALRDVIKELYDPDDIPNGIITPFPAMLLEIRDYATTKSAASKITEINLNPQRVLDDTRLKEGPAPKGAPATDQSIYISYTGDKNIVITIPSASGSNPFEYCVVKPQEISDYFDFGSLLWSTITKGTDVKVLKNKAVDNGVLIIRQKEIKSKAATRTSAAVSYELASTIVFHRIQYPNTPVVEKGSYTFVKNITLDTNKIEFDIKLNTAGRDAYEREIKSIKLGTKEIAFTTEYTPDIATYDKWNSYVITVTLDQTSLQNTPNCYNRALTITFKNGTVDKTSVLLTVKYPTEALALTVTPGKGSITGTTKVGIATDLGEGNAFGYMITPESMVGKIFVEDSMANYTNIQPFTPSTDIAVTDKTYLTVIEYNVLTGRFVKYKCIPITPEIIG